MNAPTATDPTTEETSVGRADVLHRLALIVECVDAQTRRRPRTGVRIGREVSARLLHRGHDRAWPCLDLNAGGTARAVMMLDERTPTAVSLRIVDPARRYVARRFALPLWTLAEIVAHNAAGAPVPGASRLLRPWLLPGTGAALSRGMTTVRGRVEDADGRAVRWARITAIGPGNEGVGWAHADERGEFVLVVEDTGTLDPPAPSELPVRLAVTARSPAPVPGLDDPHADLVVEAIPRSAAQPGPGDIENDVLRGRATPAEYAASSTAPTSVDVQIGQELLLAAPLAFTA